MSELLSFRDRLFNVTADNFEALAIEVFHWQASNNPVYRDYILYLKRDLNNVHKLEDVPFLPIEFFKRHKVKTGHWDSSLIFSSSGTTGAVQSSHYLDDPGFYIKLSKEIFQRVYGRLKEFDILALLPSYMEREGSSLILMVDEFMKEAGSDLSGFFLKDNEALIDAIQKVKAKQGRKLLIGVTFALLELANKHRLDLSDFIVIETGGMKGRGKELTREELHAVLKERLNVHSIHSEYGMTELMSQAYSQGDGVFMPSFPMKAMIRDVNDPFSYVRNGKTGGINIIDLGNIHSCSFVETKDLGRIVGSAGEFEVLGRFDNSDVRGCNLLIQ